jgi:hypothetical protein
MIRKNPFRCALLQRRLGLLRESGVKPPHSKGRHCSKVLESRRLRPGVCATGTRRTCWNTVLEFRTIRDSICCLQPRCKYSEAHTQLEHS